MSYDPNHEIDCQLTFLDMGPQDVQSPKRSKQKGPPRSWSELAYVPYQYMDITPGHGDLLGDPYWEVRSPLLEDGTMLNTGVAPRVPIQSTLSAILEDDPDPKYYLSKAACLGILRRAEERGKELPEQLKVALMAQAGLIPIPVVQGDLKAYHINQRDEGIDLDGVSGALMATANMQMQTFVTGEPIAFAANQRDELRDLHDIAGALGAQPGMKQQTFVAGVITKGNGDCFLSPERHTALSGGGGQAGQGYPCIMESCLTPWDTQQKRIFLPDSIAPTLAGADGGGGRDPAGLLLTAGFCAGAAPTAGSIGYQEECAPTLKASESGTNMVPSILCLNDQGGAVMELSENVSGTLRAQEHGHQPLVFDVHGQDSRYTPAGDTAQTVTSAFGAGGGNTPLIIGSQQGGASVGEGICPTITAAAGMSGNNQPVLYENHGIASRYRGPLPIAPTLSARAGTGGNNVPLVGQPVQEEQGRPSVFSRQRVDMFKDSEVVSTESARQHKDATDLVYQETVGALTSSDRKGPNSQYVGQDKLVVDGPRLIRRLTPLECERLQGFPDLWTAINGASDSARYKALGNSVAIPCVVFIMQGLSAVFMMEDDPVHYA